MIDAAARYGYGGASVARVVEQAGVSREAFYELFRNKEDAFLATPSDWPPGERFSCCCRLFRRPYLAGSCLGWPRGDAHLHRGAAGSVSKRQWFFV
jgi:hypothetical protein